MTAKCDSGWNKSSVLIQVIFMFIAFSICSFYSVDDLVFFLDHELILCNTFFLVLCWFAVGGAARKADHIMFSQDPGKLY